MARKRKPIPAHLSARCGETEEPVVCSVRPLLLGRAGQFARASAGAGSQLADPQPRSLRLCPRKIQSEISLRVEVRRDRIMLRASMPLGDAIDLPRNRGWQKLGKHLVVVRPKLRDVRLRVTF